MSFSESVKEDETPEETQKSVCLEEKLLRYLPRSVQPGFRSDQSPMTLVVVPGNSVSS